MKRLVYSPQVNVYVKSDHGIFDLSPYVTDFSVNRKVDEVSTAEVTFRNPKEVGPDGEPRFMFTQHPVENSNGTYSYEPMFHPMDPITIVLTRLRGYPVQVFTGYCDTSPYVQLFPGLARLSASCTLKRILYTYWDPGLPFVSQYLRSLGWQPEPNGSLAFSPTAETGGPVDTKAPFTDTSFGYLIYRILMDVGNWDHNDIYVQELPSEAISQTVSGIYQEITGEAKASYKQYRDFLEHVIGGTTVGGAVGSGGGTGGGGGGGGGGTADPTDENVVTNDHFNGSNIPWTFQGKASQFGSSHKYHYTDPGDDSYGSQGPASGADPDTPGFAARKTIGRKPNYNWFVVLSPSGRAAALPQTDWGPAESTGRVVDINTSAAIGVFGYKKQGNEINFPTDQGTWKLYFTGKGADGKRKAEKIVRDGRM